MASWALVTPVFLYSASWECEGGVKTGLVAPLSGLEEALDLREAPEWGDSQALPPRLVNGEGAHSKAWCFEELR